ncbi:TBC1 domain family member 20-like [Mercenaria mercenaria]|uniref:TBC1 domain family member 20-like n=1 Tax=Mercenaria mercenaria TaxID=6596 RepID=UPI00234F4FA4|nr:TBC1 domain family member 20-like [Mercenaria mercenaria]
MPIYLAAAIVLYRQKEILEIECDMCILHGLLSKIPDDLPYEQLIVRAGELYQKYSPDELAHEAILNFKRSQELAKARIQNRQRPVQKKVVKRKRWISLFYLDGSSIYLKLTFWTLTAVFSAALIAYFKSSNWEKGWWT